MGPIERAKLRDSVEMARWAHVQVQSVAAILEAGSNHMDPLLPAKEARALADVLAAYISDAVLVMSPGGTETEGA